MGYHTGPRGCTALTFSASLAYLAPLIPRINTVPTDMPRAPVRECTVAKGISPDCPHFLRDQQEGVVLSKHRHLSIHHVGMSTIHYADGRPKVKVLIADDGFFSCAYGCGERFVDCTEWNRTETRAKVRVTHDDPAPLR